MSIPAEAMTGRILRKAVYLDSTFLGNATTLCGVRAILRSEGRPQLADNIVHHCVEGQKAFFVTTEELKEPSK